MNKATFEWNSQFDIDIPKMNEEHRELLNIMARIENLCRHNVSKSSVLSAYDNLLKYARTHFQHEEQIMRTMNFPGLEQHALIHKDLIEKLEKYRKEFILSSSLKLPTSVFDFFKNWLLTHILIADRQYNDHKKTHLPTS